MYKLVARTRLFFLIPFLSLFSFVILGVSQPALADGVSYVRFIHAIAKQGPIDLYVDGQAFKTQIPFALASDYTTIPAGTHDIIITPSGSATSAAIINQKLTFNEGIPYTLAAVGSQVSDASFVLTQDDNRIPANGLVKTRVYDFCPDAGPVSIATQGQTFVNNLNYKQVSPYLTVPAGSYTFHASNAQGNALTVTNDLSNPNLVYSLFVVGFVNGDPKVQGVGTATPAVVGLPNTGNDPNYVPATSQPPLVLEIGLGSALAVIVCSLLYVFVKKSHLLKRSV